MIIWPRQIQQALALSLAQASLGVSLFTHRVQVVVFNVLDDFRNLKSHHVRLWHPTGNPSTVPAVQVSDNTHLSTYMLIPSTKLIRRGPKVAEEVLNNMGQRCSYRSRCLPPKSLEGSQARSRTEGSLRRFRASQTQLCTSCCLASTDRPSTS